MASRVKIFWDETAIKLESADPRSPAARGMRMLADETVTEMKRRAPVYTGPPRRGPTAEHPRQPPPRASGTLRSSIRAFRQPSGNYLIGPTDQVAPGVFLGPMIEKGTRPHLIRSHGPWPLYSTTTGRRYGHPETRQRRDTRGRFTSGRVVANWVVHHPGTRPHPFIRLAAEAMNGRSVHVLGHRKMLPGLPGYCRAHRRASARTRIPRRRRRRHPRTPRGDPRARPQP